MFYYNKWKIIGISFIVTILLGGIAITLYYTSKGVIYPASSNADTSSTEPFKEEDLSTGIVAESEERDMVPKAEDTEVESKSKPSVGDIVVSNPSDRVDHGIDSIPGVGAEQSTNSRRWEIVSGKQVASLTPFIDWSSGEIIGEDLKHMYKVVERILNDAADKDTNVIVSPPTSDEMTAFKVPILFYVTKDGNLLLNCKVTTQDLEREKEKDTFQSITLRYNMEKIEVVE